MPSVTAGPELGLEPASRVVVAAVAVSSGETRNTPKPSCGRDAVVERERRYRIRRRPIIGKSEYVCSNSISGEGGHRNSDRHCLSSTGGRAALPQGEVRSWPFRMRLVL